jgi:hypothetical protein
LAAKALGSNFGTASALVPAQILLFCVPVPRTGTVYRIIVTSTCSGTGIR